MGCRSAECIISHKILCFIRLFRHSVYHICIRTVLLTLYAAAASYSNHVHAKIFMLSNCVHCLLKILLPCLLKLFLLLSCFYLAFLSYWINRKMNKWCLWLVTCFDCKLTVTVTLFYQKKLEKCAVFFWVFCVVHEMLLGSAICILVTDYL
jgi:hypothetical protein